jgi:hypothetical protein
VGGGLRAREVLARPTFYLLADSFDDDPFWYGTRRCLTWWNRSPVWVLAPGVRGYRHDGLPSPSRGPGWIAPATPGAVWQGSRGY